MEREILDELAEDITRFIKPGSKFGPINLEYKYKKNSFKTFIETVISVLYFDKPHYSYFLSEYNQIEIGENEVSYIAGYLIGKGKLIANNGKYTSTSNI